MVCPDSARFRMLRALTYVTLATGSLEVERKPRNGRHAQIHHGSRPNVQIHVDHTAHAHDATPQFEYCPHDPSPPRNGSITTASSTQCYSAKLQSIGQDPVLSRHGGTSDFNFVFNPSWVEASEGTGGRQGLLVRLQNCSACACCGCQGTGAKASKLAFVPLLSKDGPDDTPVFGRVSAESVVFGPHDAVDDMGTEDPRVTYNSKTGLYHILYTCFGTGGLHVEMCHATTRNPTVSSGWVRHGSVGFGTCSKSGAMLLQDDGSHFMFWGAPQIKVARSTDPLKWTSTGERFINSTFWGSQKVEPGPPPLRLSTGDYAFFLNSWNDEWPEGIGYQPTWVILSGKDPTKIIAQATEPLWNSKKALWMEGEAPHACNKKRVVFIGAAHHTDTPDVFRVYFGGADAVVGTAVVSFKKVTDAPCPESSHQEHLMRRE